MIAALLALAQAAAAPAAPARPVRPEEADARCLAAFGALAGNSGADVQRAAQLGGLYFYGKLLGRNPGIDLVAALRAATPAVAADPRGELQRCGAEMQRAGDSLIATGRAMGATAPAPTATPTPTPSPTPTPRR